MLIVLPKKGERIHRKKLAKEKKSWYAIYTMILCAILRSFFGRDAQK